MVSDLLGGLSPHFAAYSALAILAVMFIGFVREAYPPEGVAFLGAVAMLLLGFVDSGGFSNALTNTAPWTIAAMFVLSGAMVRTGVISAISHALAQRLKTKPIMVLFLGSLTVILLSAFMNNTPIVAMMIPAVIQLSGTMGIYASRALIPLSYLAILGGTLTLIGTSTNLLVSGIANANGMAAFSLFEVTPVAIFLVLWGWFYIAFIAGRLLPDRPSMAEMLVDRKKMSFFTEVLIPDGSQLVGRNVMDVESFKHADMRVIDVLRGDESLRRQFPEVELHAGDRVVLRTNMGELLGLKENNELELVDQISSRKTVTVEALISPGCALIGRRLGPLRLRRRYGVYPLAVHRSSQNLGRQLDDVVVRVGDTLLLEGAPEDIKRLSDDAGLVALSEIEERSYRRDKAPIVIAVWLAMLIATAMGLMPIFTSSLLAAGVVIAVRAIDLDEALESVEGSILLLIFSMLVVGQGLENSGAIAMIVDGISPHLASLKPFFLVWAVFLLTSIMTELLSNNAVAVIITPVAIALAAAIGVDPRPLVVAVMIGASCAFATPIGYQTNTLVYAPGGYKFTDFTRAGLPLNLSIGLLAAWLIPYFFPL